jgi:phosphatidylglycerol lysyltransferase
MRPWCLLGDKRILFADDDAGFLMFQIQGRSWAVAGDPVGPPAVAEALAWRFRELCDRYGGRPAFTHVNPAHLPLYFDLCLAPLKRGEEAVVDLTGFSLDGSQVAWMKAGEIARGVGFSDAASVCAER